MLSLHDPESTFFFFFLICSRVLCGTRVFTWDDESLVSVLGSVLLKMAASPHETVKLIDSERPYIIMTKDKWIWAKVKFPRNFALNYAMPTSNTQKFILIADFRGGADGRVWMVCSMSGRVGVIKFPQEDEQRGEADDAPIARLKKELKHWQTIWGYSSCRIVKLAGQSALLMPYIKPVVGGGGAASGRETDIINTVPGEVQELVKDAVREMASKGVYHADLHWGHVGVVSPQKRGQQRRAIMYDLARVGTASPNRAMRLMMKSLHFQDSEDDNDPDDDDDQGEA